ncbi:MAG: gliding motility-associated C-terminal domain-containing protein [Flavobacteriales bacterium]|jgi:gliding motility-associated-like protein|nr:gliding motility-associated C-terminal domain-containing protein [Flavobacteriales bacterium]
MKNLFRLLILIPFFGFSQFSFNMDSVKVCYSGQYFQISSLPPYLDHVDFSINNLDTVFNVTDDVHSGAINMGFNFKFYGTNYNQAVISTNGYVTFNTVHANTGSQWAIGSPIPNGVNSDAYNSVMCPYTDSYPAANSTMIYGTAGVAPNRAFIVIWNDFIMYNANNCPGFCYSSSVIFLEGSNKIINSIYSYDFCNNWNGGTAVQGLYKDANSALIINDPVTGQPRNQGNNWTANVETWIYSPSGNTYTYQLAPQFTNLVVPTWHDAQGNQLGYDYVLGYTAPNINSLPTVLTAQSIQCNDTVEVNIPVVLDCPPPIIQPVGESCPGLNDGEIIFQLDPQCNIVGTEWEVTLLDKNNNPLGQSFKDSIFPMTFTNLAMGLYHISYESPQQQNCFDTVPVIVPRKFYESQYHATVTPVACKGESTGIIEIVYHGGTNKDWTLKIEDNAGQLIESTQTDFTKYSFKNLKKGEYTITINSGTTCETIAKYTVTEPDELRFTKTDYNHNQCSELTSFMDFTIAGGNPPYEYFLDSAKIIAPNFQKLNTGEHHLEVVDARGCIITHSFPIRDLWSPKVDYDFIDKEYSVDEATVKFTNKTEINPWVKIDSYWWEFGDGVTSSEENPTHTFTQSGNYIVDLIVSDDNGCVANKQYTVRVVAPDLIFPNAFTPNGDGQNEFFKPVPNKVSNDDYKFHIFDRWGKEVFSTQNLDEGWSGLNKDGEIESGTYIYKVYFTDVYGVKKEKQGYIQLIK